MKPLLLGDRAESAIPAHSSLASRFGAWARESLVARAIAIAAGPATPRGDRRVGARREPEHARDRSGDPRSPSARVPASFASPAAPRATRPASRARPPLPRDRRRSRRRSSLRPELHRLAPHRPPASRATPDDPVDLNTAHVSDLRRLPGVGEKRAEAILALRARLPGGRFRQLEDLLKVKGVGRAMLKRIHPLVRLGARSRRPSACSRPRVESPEWRDEQRQSCRSLKLARFATSIVEIWATSSRSSSPFCASVVPVSTRSTISSARPVIGASSTEPCTYTTSAWIPRRAKCAAAVRGYFVATRGRLARAAPPAARAPGQPGHDHPAATEAEVQRPIKLTRALGEHVPSADPEVGRAVLHVGRHVVGLQQEEADVGRHLADERPVVGEERGALDAGAREERRQRLQAPPLGDGDREWTRAHASAPRTRSMSAPIPRSLSSMCS